MLVNYSFSEAMSAYISFWWIWIINKKNKTSICIWISSLELSSPVICLIGCTALDQVPASPRGCITLCAHRTASQ